jgi:hypothetical protein
LGDLTSGTGLLDGCDLRGIDSAAAEIEVQGDRYPEHLRRLVLTGV